MEHRQENGFSLEAQAALQPHQLLEQIKQKQQEIVEQMRQARAQSQADIPARTLAWLTLPPYWTLALAHACSFPCIGSSTVDETFERLVREQLCTRQEGEDDDHYVVSDTTRSELYQQLSEKEGLHWFLREMSRLGEHLLDYGAAALSPEIERYATLAIRVRFGVVAWSPGEVTDTLDTETKRLLQLGQSGEALRWIVTARRFEELLGDEMTFAIQRASRRLDLYHRRADDLRALARFLPRSRQIDAFKALLTGPDEHYMLHYIGDGGMGKTMLARYLNSTLADELQLSTARIDFDYLNPDFPLRRPGLLLQELAVELRLQDEDDNTKRVAQHFRRFDEKVLREHELRSGLTLSAGERLWTASAQGRFSLDAPGVREMLIPFADAITALPRQPVVLILDTCEELAKTRPDGSLPASVQATFSMLDSLHQLVPSMRVIFCGRRPLSAEGADWEMRVKDPNWNIKREDLLLHEIRGFTGDEAIQYLAEKATLPEVLREPVIERSRMPAEQSRFLWKNAPQQNAPEELYNPFDLALYASWMNEALSELAADSDMQPLVDELRGLSGDRYAEMRIVRRNPLLAPLLPTVTLLGRFEKELLHTVLPYVPTDFETLFHELTQQEWLDRQQAIYYEVKRGLLPRLRAYYQQAAPETLERARSSILAHLEQITLERDLSTLDISHFDIALRLFTKEPERAARWWRAVEERVARSESYAWFRPVSEYLLSDSGAAAGISPTETRFQEHPLRCAVLATHCAILTHTEPETDRGPYWQEVAQKAERYPLSEEGKRLSQRALCGQLTSVDALAAMSAEEFLERRNKLWQGLNELASEQIDEQLYASYAAALESVLSASVAALYPHKVEPVLFPIPEELSVELKGFLWMLTGRLLSKAGKGNEAQTWFQQAVEVSPGKAQQAWLDWLMPDNLSARVQLEYVHAFYPLILSVQAITLYADRAEVEQMVTAFIDLSGSVADIDAERLLAAWMLLRGYTHYHDIYFPQHTSYRLVREVGPLYRSTCDVHHLYPPLFAVLAGIMADNGLVSEALEYLASYKKEAERLADRIDIVAAADRASLQIIRRMRLRDENWPFTAGQIDGRMYWALEGLDGPKAATFKEQPFNETYPDDMSAEKRAVAMRYTLHSRWRSTYALDPERKPLVYAWFAESIAALFDPAAWDYVSIALRLDMLELELLSHPQDAGPFFASLSSRDALRLAQWFANWTERPVEALTQGLRYSALSNNYRVPEALVERLGKRRAASIALDEGELLALRLPANAARLLLQARTWFAETEDYGQAWIAGTCRMLALMRLKRNPELEKSAVAWLQGDYDTFEKRLKDMVPEIPSWETVEAIALHPTSDALDNLAPKAWRPWLVRLIACLIPFHRNAQGPVVLLSWLEARYGTHYGLVGSQVRLPAELDGLFGGIFQDSLYQGSFYTALKINPGLRKGPFEKNAPITLAIDLAQVGRGQALHWVIPSIEEPITASLRLLNEPTDANADWNASAIEAYATGAFRLTQHSNQEFVQALLFHRNGRPTTEPIILQLVQQTCGICWEGILTLALQGRTPDWRTLRFHRIIPVLRRTTTVAFKEKQLECFTGNTQQAALLRNAWEPLERQKWSINVNLGVSLASLLQTVVQLSVAVLHLVTSPVETASGLRIENATTYREARSEELLEVESIPDRFPNLKFCILQCPPQENTARTSSERAQIGNMRLLAARLFAAGVPLVLTIPVLSQEQAERVLALLAQALLKAEWKEALDTAMIDARLALLETGTETDTERAFDLCLYTGDDTDYR